MKKVRIYPYDMRSISSRKLREKLSTMGIDCIRVYRNRSYIPRSDHLIVNWGNSDNGRCTWCSPGVVMLNQPQCVSRAINKVDALLRMSYMDVPTVPFTTREYEARQWAETYHKVFERHDITGRSGKGIVVCSGRSPDSAPLYTKYVPDTREYRVHVFGNRAVHVRQKRRKRNWPDHKRNDIVRTHKTGWVYCKGMDKEPEQGTVDAAIFAVRALGLDFGAVDVLEDQYGAPYVLEVNTAPGIENSTVDIYANEIRSLACL